MVSEILSLLLLEQGGVGLGTPVRTSALVFSNASYHKE